MGDRKMDTSKEIKERIEKVLSKCMDGLSEEYKKKNLDEKISQRRAEIDFQFWTNDPTLKRLESAQNILNVRCRDLNTLRIKIKFMEFIKLYDDSMKQYYSPYKTFCDREKFYYEWGLAGLSDEALTQVVCCEIFNSMQDYFITEKLNPRRKAATEGNSLAMMHHINLLNVKKFSWYSERREELADKLNSKYPDLKAISFPPNENAAKYLYNEMIKCDRDVEEYKLADMTYGEETANVTERLIYCYYYELTKYAGIRRLKSSDYKRILYSKDEHDRANEKLNSRGKEAREHGEALKIVKELIG